MAAPAVGRTRTEEREILDAAKRWLRKHPDEATRLPLLRSSGEQAASRVRAAIATCRRQEQEALADGRPVDVEVARRRRKEFESILRSHRRTLAYTRRMFTELAEVARSETRFTPSQPRPRASARAVRSVRRRTSCRARAPNGDSDPEPEPVAPADEGGGVSVLGGAA
jgi:hypothetical protein